ncbi:unnamed protein product [Rhizophagus irregularis]|nr:unnamed protein product [Rhizophagus irregularis]
MSVFKIAEYADQLRKDSCNKKLLLRTQQLCSEHIKGATIEIIDWSQCPFIIRISNLILHNRYTTVFRVH